MKLPKDMEFFIYLLEHYAAYKGISADQALESWRSHGLEQEILANYEMYHTERLENAFADIDSLIATGKHAW
ncbi:DUF3791 domain-containing protein [Bifidobacterium oedipodis]|uniref:DUF3791 domain-containing protein n=1 Tax=Bifidobacterium oedipodis TaxID=2675322 RepID=A0A7Y0HTR8_9BIFI|nr:DUF3791 domain-containing protein [Bifidobacterium sp. DSM 109957]NMM93979.1 hypothetical protein [Bifidobacterium sp. DSM 109957]